MSICSKGNQDLFINPHNYILRKSVKEFIIKAMKLYCGDIRPVVHMPASSDSIMSGRTAVTSMSIAEIGSKDCTITTSSVS